jgi:hypothetical protein
MMGYAKLINAPLQTMMALNKKNRLNLLVGVALTGIVTLPTLTIVLGDARQPSFSPDNAWAWLASLILLACGFAISTIGLMRTIHWGYFVWSQTILSFLVLILYIGWYRRELDYAKLGPDPDAIDQGPPVATWQGFLFLVLMWLIPGFLPLALMGMGRWYKARKYPSRQVGANSSDETTISPTAPGYGTPSQASIPESPPIANRPLPVWLDRGLRGYGLVAYVFVAGLLGLHLGVIKALLEGGAGYALAHWWIRRTESRSGPTHPAVTVTVFLCLHACLASIIDVRLVGYLLLHVLGS